MERLIDRIIICVLMVFVGRVTLTDRYLIVVIYGMLSIAFFNFFFLYDTNSKKSLKPNGAYEIIAFIIQIITALIAVFNHSFILLVPVAVYDMIVLRNVMGIMISLLSFYLYYEDVGNMTVLASLMAVALISVYLSVKSERLMALRRNVNELRDETVIREDLLRERNMSLLKAKDDEIYLSTLKERNRIAREIHDNAGHMLTRAILQLGALITICKDESLKGGLNELKSTLDTAMNSMRNSVHDLRDESIDLPSAVKDIVKPLYDDKTVNLDIDISSELDTNIKYAVIGVIKESVSNIIKHSTNDIVDINFIEHPAFYLLVVHDYSNDKKGKSAAPSFDKRGMGLENIRARVSNVGGNVTISAEDGFKVYVTIKKESI